MLMSWKPKVIVADQDDIFRSAIGTYLSENGFVVDLVRDAQEMLDLPQRESYDLIVVCLTSLDLDALTFLRHLRSQTSQSCMIISDKYDMVDRVLGLELGADDYLSNLTDKREILARARAILRRAQLASMHQAPPAMPVTEKHGRLRFERVQRRLESADGTTIALTTAEYNLLSSFTSYVNQPLTRERLYELVYNRRWSAFDRTLDTLVAKLRRKIERDPQQPELIKTVHGTGYVFTGADFACKD